MSYDDVLLIGGPADGQMVSVLRGVNEVLLPQPPDQAVSITDEGRKPFPKDMSIASYKRADIQGPSGWLSVYVADGLDPIKALVENYRKP
ncbi:hypothetical protein PCP38_00685 [Pseudomonas aeruginosa]|uniref:hypothetical protein n=1 Tax=Pseudomonas aeruginosa TaxID=287 RepID=UPI0011B78F1F|nr:hypothetical protein [Pseudomonas aeruginosa]MCO1981657.1 hypothetical protein [Pseudomonas aeruginosa]TWW38950.1 hypothetical protein FSB80_22525 [Pseudomonas aeruginosa]TWX98674.1 hypothetical protein FS694_21975 [Pseudomonas aeruginosa]HCF5688201.1 hypothetical protein [Pseudomonas aeruginosa]